MKTNDFYLIRTLSNLHVGSGEGDFSVVDKQVQRDPVSELPVIHSSGIKGALREAMKYHEEPDAHILSIFGADVKRSNGSIQQGRYNFFDGKLLALPARSSHDFFYVATCPQLIEGLIEDLGIFHPDSPFISHLKELQKTLNSVSKDAPKYLGVKAPDKVRLEDWTAVHDSFDISEIKGLFGTRIALFHNDDFKTLAKELPIIARNYLENGISKNLWYEEVVPREARFYTVISRPVDDSDQLGMYIKDTRNNIVQLGGNATVGYGLCEFKSFDHVTKN